MDVSKREPYAQIIGALKREHVVLGIFNYSDKPVGDATVSWKQSFTLNERKLFLAMTCAIVWITVWLKYFYLSPWFKTTQIKELEGLESDLAQLRLFPEDRISDLVDSMAVAIVGSVIQVVVGKPVVKFILKKDFERKSGFLGFVHSFVFVYAAAFSVMGAFHLIVWLLFNLSKVVLVFKVLVKLFASLILNIGVVETARTAFVEGLLPWMKESKKA